MIDSEATEAPVASLKNCTQKPDVKLFRGVFLKNKSGSSVLGFYKAESMAFGQYLAWGVSRSQEALCPRNSEQAGPCNVVEMRPTPFLIASSAFHESGGKEAMNREAPLLPLDGTGRLQQPLSYGGCLQLCHH